MEIKILVMGFALFLAALALHLALWRLVRIKQEILVVISIFLGFPLIVLIYLMASGMQPLQAAAVGLLSWALGLVYIQIYPAFKKDIPTFQILLLLHSQPSKEFSMEEIRSNIDDDSSLFSEKINELESDRLVNIKNGQLFLSIKGKFVAALFGGYRKLLCLPEGIG